MKYNQKKIKLQLVVDERQHVEHKRQLVEEEEDERHGEHE